jgi:hypothetical protein
MLMVSLHLTIRNLISYVSELSLTPGRAKDGVCDVSRG